MIIITVIVSIIFKNTPFPEKQKNGKKKVICKDALLGDK